MSAQVPAWQPSPGHTQLPIWPTTIAAGRPGVIAETLGQGTKPVAGRPWLYIGHVTVPTLTVYSPEGNNTGAAVVVFPGGGYEILAIDLEGTEVCDWLVSRGITCVLLKYRVPNQGGSWDQGCGCDRRTGSSRPLEDAQRAIALVRFHAADWHIDPHKIGVLGFSAGGHLVAAVSTHFDRPVYRAVDSADQESTRPDFAVAVYPGHLFDRRTGSLYHDLPVTARTPPTLLVQAENDEVDPPNHSIFYFMALKKAGVPAELHLYAEGGHAFGLRPTNFPITAWPRLVETWLKTIGMTSP
ncbi:MAG: alpha/beta hydrolase [Gemmatimonadota bacterium]